FFFFQAEDGIRDPLVTGVQTCALPIYRLTAPEAERTDPPACGRQRQTAEADDAMLPELRHGTGPPRLGCRIGDDERLLGLDHPSGVVSVDRLLRECRESHAGRLENPSTRGAAFELKNHETDTVEADNKLL